MTFAQHRNTSPQARDRSIDVLRGLGMVVIVLGHLDASGVGGAWITYLYSFNVALFFIVSGYMWRERPGTTLVALAMRKFRQIYVPYVVLFVVSLLYGHVIVRYVFGQYVIPFEWRPTLKALLYGSDWLNTVPTFNFALWFLPIFFVASLAFELVQRVRPFWLRVTILGLILLGSLPLQQLLPGRPPLAINVLPVAVAFMGCGYLLRRWANIGRMHLPFAISLFAFTLAVTYFAPGNVAAIGTLWYFPSALASFALYLRLSQDIASSRFFAFVGENSLIIFGLHGLIANTYTHTGIPRLFEAWDHGLLLYLINAAYVLLGSVAVVSIYRWARKRVTDRHRRATPGFSGKN